MNQKTILAPNEDSVEDINHMKSYHSDDAEFSDGAGEEDEDNMRGVSNVVYRKEYPFDCGLDRVEMSRLFICLPRRSSVSERRDRSALW